MQVAVFAGGCFWGVEDILRKVKGVTKIEVGYTGGDVANPKYEQVKTGTTGHAEAVRIEFDPKQVSYDTLLDYFFRLHDPTTLNQQGNDKGSQYRSAIFYQNEDQKKAALAKMTSKEVVNRWKKLIVTQVVPAKPWYPAEEYHQDYLVKNPGGYTCHWLRD